MKVLTSLHDCGTICGSRFVWHLVVLKTTSKTAKTLITMLIIMGLGNLLLFLVPIATIMFSSLPSRAAAPFECGFEPAGPRVVPFCPKFWLVAILFLLFDVEVALLMPIGNRLDMGYIFLSALVIGTGLEYGVGSLDWVA